MVDSVYQNALTTLRAAETDVSLKTVNAQCKRSLNADISLFRRTKVRSLLVQGKFYELLHTEESDATWKSFIFDLPRGVCKFVLNACSDTLPTNRPLCRWGKKTCDKCKHCHNKETLLHILNNCRTFLEQGRYTWRHNNILAYLHSVLRNGLEQCLPPSAFSLTVDLPDSNERFYTTIPLECTTTNLIPDMTLFFPDKKELHIIELTVPFLTLLHEARTRKTNKYDAIVADVSRNGFKVTLSTIEVGSRGFINDDNIITIKSLLKVCNCHRSFSTVKHNLSRLAILSSYSIFYARAEPTWQQPPTLKP